MNVKRYEWVACDEHACHCDVIESAEGDMVDYEDYAALEARCAALAAENAAMHETIEAVRSVADNSSGIAGWHLNGDIATWEEILPEINEIETPATDAFLAEMRAQGVEMLAKETEKLEWHESTVRFVLRFAAQIRKGVQS